jgi:hypothetical protein
VKRYDIFLSDGHRLTTNEEGYRAIRAGVAGDRAERLIRLSTVRGERVTHNVEINVDQIVTISPVDEDS